MKQQILTSSEFKKQNQIRTAKKVKTAGANQLTKAIIAFLNVNGCIAFRNNTVGIVDPKKVIELIFDLIKQAIATRQLPKIKEVQKAFKKCFRKSHDRKGASDIVGIEKKTGKFIAIEVKVGKDELSLHQRLFLKDIVKSGGIAIVARTFDQFVSDFNNQKYFEG